MCYLSIKVWYYSLTEHDNARPHAAHITRQFLNQNNINVLPWPSMSPCMNPIEYLWYRMERYLEAATSVSLYPRHEEFRNSWRECRWFYVWLSFNVSRGKNSWTRSEASSSRTYFRGHIEWQSHIKPATYEFNYSYWSTLLWDNIWSTLLWDNINKTY